MESVKEACMPGMEPDFIYHPYRVTISLQSCSNHRWRRNYYSGLVLDLCWITNMGKKNSREDLREIQERYSFIVNAYGEMMTLITDLHIEM